MKERKMIGAVAKCRHGKVGVISSMEIERHGDKKSVLYRGVTLDGKAWQSCDPTILAPTVNKYIEEFVLQKEPAEVSI